MKEKIIKTIVIQMIGLMLAQIMVLTYNPIGIAYFSVAYVLSPYRILTFPLMLISMGTRMGLVDVSKYAMVMLVIVSCNGMYELKKKKIHVNSLAAITGVAILCMEIADTLMITYDYKGIIISFFVGVLSAMLTLVFYKGVLTIKNAKINSMLKNEEMISIAIITGLVIYYVINLDVLPPGIAETFIYFAILFLGFRYGAGMGAITGSACGVVISIMHGDAEALGIMCALGILAGAFRKIGRMGSVLSFACGVFMAGSLFTYISTDIGVLRGLVSASIIFLILPKNIVYQDEKIIENNHNTVPTVDNSGLNMIVESLKKLSNTFYDLPSKKTNLGRSEVESVIKDLSNSICKDCENCNYCWKERGFNTYEETQVLLNAAKNGYALSIEDIPSSLSGRCSKTNAFVTEINHLFDRARLNLIWENKILESREVVADQLKEVAVLLEDYSKNVYNFVPLEGDQVEHIKRKLRTHRIIMKKIVMLEKKNRILEIVITAKTEKGECVSSKEMANILGEIIGKRCKPMKDCKTLVCGEYATYNLIEDANFHVVHGSARRTSSNEEVSGDNFSVLDFANGQILASLSDGMGSGINACRDSETVLELLEQLLESGFSEEVSLKLINSVMLLNTQAESPATLDMAVVDLYSGVCDLIKLGAASTFIKRGNWVEAIKSTTLPVGVVNNLDIESVSKKLYNGDYIIMVSDGITDKVDGEDKEREISKIIMDIDSNNPNEIANRILSETLEKSTNSHEDDMTVLVLGLWEKYA